MPLCFACVRLSAGRCYLRTTSHAQCGACVALLWKHFHFKRMIQVSQQRYSCVCVTLLRRDNSCINEVRVLCEAVVYFSLSAFGIVDSFTYMFTLKCVSILQPCRYYRGYWIVSINICHA